MFLSAPAVLLREQLVKKNTLNRKMAYAYASFSEGISFLNIYISAGKFQKL